MAIIRLPGHTLSNSAAARSKHWLKLLTGVDQTQTTGYAFQGTFASFESTVELAEGAWVLSYIEYVRGSGRLDNRDIALYRVAGDELVTVEEWSLDGKAGWALKVRDQIATHLAAAALATEPLRVERARLAARIAEIDALLAGSVAS